MRFKRACGTLLHPTSFPSAFGIGDFGPAAHYFLFFLEDCGQSIWQILPLGPTGYGNSPYASYSAFAGNHYLISPDVLVHKKLLLQDEIEAVKVPSTHQVHYDKAYEIKDKLFPLACQRFYKHSDTETRNEFEEFKKNNSYWLEDYTLFMACLVENKKQPWNTWEPGLAMRKPAALNAAKKRLKSEIAYHTWLQFEFFSEWHKVKHDANERDIIIMGDIPIFVDHNSADVWSHPEFFEVDENGNRLLVAGVPPDYFSVTGQLWGNPLYKWDVLERDGYSWWVKRFEQMFQMYDSIRVDHFRGFDAYWEVQASAITAEKGRWVKGPGEKLFTKIKKELGDLPIIAEDLGVITQSVVDLRESFGFPGMKILQFSFGDSPSNNFLPHNYNSANCVVYTGTHDNDTTIGWYLSAPEKDKHHAREYTRSDGTSIHWELIRTGMMSVADQAIFPLQDFLGLGTEHRMNLPGTTVNNWMWRYTNDMLMMLDSDAVRNLIELSNRNPRRVQTDSNIIDLHAEDR